jgi:hypothetical protein
MSIVGSWPSETVPSLGAAPMGIIIGDVISVCRPALLIPRIVSRYPVLLASERDLKRHCNNYYYLREVTI